MRAGIRYHRGIDFPLAASARQPMKYANILQTIGNTPVVRLNKVTGSLAGELSVKVESFNPGGSVKDRPALNMIEDTERRGVLQPGDVLVEPTSGNTGIGPAMVAAPKGYRTELWCSGPGEWRSCAT